MATGECADYVKRKCKRGWHNPECRGKGKKPKREEQPQDAGGASNRRSPSAPPGRARCLMSVSPERLTLLT
jgi:hypothetical protein